MPCFRMLRNPTLAGCSSIVDPGFRNLHVPQKTQLSRAEFFEHPEKTYVSEIDFLPIFCWFFADFLLIFCRFFADFLLIFLGGAETVFFADFLLIFLFQLKHNNNNCSRRTSDWRQNYRYTNFMVSCNFRKSLEILIYRLHKLISLDTSIFYWNHGLQLIRIA